MSNEYIDLSIFDDAYIQAEEIADANTVPDGTYDVVINKAELTTSMTTGGPLLKLELKIIGSKYSGKIMKSKRAITENTLKWVKHDLKTCGLNIARLSELPSNLEKLLDVCLSVTQKTKGDNKNIYINKKITAQINNDILPF
jgi:hypothetical protein